MVAQPSSNQIPHFVSSEGTYSTQKSEALGHANHRRHVWFGLLDQTFQQGLPFLLLWSRRRDERQAHAVFTASDDSCLCRDPAVWTRLEEPFPLQCQRDDSAGLPSFFSDDVNSGRTYISHRVL